MSEPVPQREVAARPENATPFKPDLGLQAILLAGIQDGKFKAEPVAQKTVEDKLAKTPGERWSFEDVDKASMSERKAKGVSREKWSPLFQEKVGKMKPKQKQQLEEAMTVLGDGTLLQPDQMLEKFAFAEKPGQQKSSDTKAFLEKIITLPDVNKKMKTVKFLAQSLFGAETAGKMVAQMVDLEGKIIAVADLKTPKARQQARDALVQKLVESSKQIKGSDAEQTINSANALLGASGAEQVNAAEKGIVGGDSAGALSEIARKTEMRSSGNIGVSSETGKRDEQQDFVWSQIENLPKGINSIAIVADGHGVSGETASRLGSQYFLDAFNRSMGSGKDVRTAITEAISQTENSLANQTPDGGTTFVASIRVGEKVYIVNVGDSRAYKVGESQTQQLTTDHNWPEGGHRYNIALSRSLGDSDIKQRAGGEMSANPDIFETTLRAGEQIVLCSDGIHNVLTPQEIQSLIKGRNPQEASAILVEEAIKKGSTDNVSAIILPA